MFRERVSSAHVIALAALFVALGGSAYAGGLIGTSKIRNNAVTTAKIKNNAVTTVKLGNGSVTPAKMKEYFNSGLVKLDNDQSKVLLERGPFRLTADCAEIGPGESVAHLWIQNTGTANALFQSDYLANYQDPVFDPGEKLEAFYTASGDSAYWFGDYYNMFSVTSADGRTSLIGNGNIGVKVLESDCAFQLFAWGS